MIALLDSGDYRMIETKANTKVLELGGATFAWINAKDIGEILVTTYKEYETDAILSVGKFRLYEVKDEPGITDLNHLELEAGEGIWQSYLLLTGLPTEAKKRTRIIPSKDHITGSKNYLFKIKKRLPRPKRLLEVGGDKKKGG